MERIDEGVVISDGVDMLIGAEGIEEVVCDASHDAGWDRMGLARHGEDVQHS